MDKIKQVGWHVKTLCNAMQIDTPEIIVDPELNSLAKYDRQHNVLYLPDCNYDCIAAMVYELLHDPDTNDFETVVNDYSYVIRYMRDYMSVSPTFPWMPAELKRLLYAMIGMK